jgi:hypothetical protein
MVFSLRSPNLSGRPAETPKAFAKTLKVSEIPEISEKNEKENANFVRRFRIFLWNLQICFEPNA